MIKSEWTMSHYENKKITKFLESIESLEGREAACGLLNFIKEEYPEIARPLFGDLIWSETKEGTCPQL